MPVTWQTPRERRAENDREYLELGGSLGIDCMLSAFLMTNHLPMRPIHGINIWFAGMHV